MDIKKYCANLVEKDGIYFSKKESLISYPESGNETCFQIEENSFWFNHRNKCIASAVKKYSPNDIFFDIGGGNGYVAQSLERVGIPTVLIEPGIQGCLNAKKRNLENIVCSTLENALFKKNSIPAIGLFDVVEHIEDDVALLTSIYSYIKPQGYAYITVPAFNYLWSKEDEDAGHFRRYTLENLTNKLKDVGFHIEYSTYIFSILVPAVFLLRSLPSKLGLNKSSDNFNKHSKEHATRKGIFGKAIGKVWVEEVVKIQKGKKIPFGSSCFIVARK